MKVPSLEDIVNSYSRFVPHQFLQLLGKTSVTDIVLGESIEKRMTILFSDIRNFTSLSEAMTPRENFRFINSYLECMEPVITGHNGIIDKYMGDSIMALFPVSADSAIDAAIAMIGQLALFNKENKDKNYPPVSIGIGINTGIMMLGTIGGRNRMESTVISDAVNLASRVESMTKDLGVPVLVTEHTYQSLKDPSKYKIRYADRVKVKGKEQPQSIYEVFSADSPKLSKAKQKRIKAFENAIAYYYLKEIPKAFDLLDSIHRQCPDDTLAKLYLNRCSKYLKEGVYDGSGVINLSIEWNSGFEIGVGRIDEQHRQLFTSVKSFIDSLQKEHDFSQSASIMDFLKMYVLEHFRTEEEIMSDHGYPFFELEKTQHERFTEHFMRLDYEIKNSTRDDWHFLLFKIQVLVIDWLIYHTFKLDKHFGKFLKTKQTVNK